MARNCEFVYGSDLIQQILILFTRSSGKPPRIIIILYMVRDGWWMDRWMDGWLDSSSKVLPLLFYFCCFYSVLLLSSFIQLTLAVESVKH